MNKENIKNDIVKFIYNEASTDEALYVAEGLEENDLNEFFDQMVDTKKVLDNIALSPSKGVIDRILQFSKKCTVDTTH